MWARAWAWVWGMSSADSLGALGVVRLASFARVAVAVADGRRKERDSVPYVKEQRGVP